MILPIWVASWEIECCQPDAVVGQAWEAPLLVLAPPEPWWKEYVEGPLPEDVAALGVSVLEGNALDDAPAGDAAVFQSGPVRVLLPGPVVRGPHTRSGRLTFQGHGPFLPSEELVCRGVVKRVRGIPLVYVPRGRGSVPVGQEHPVDVSSTLRRRFPEFLVDLDVQAAADPPSDSCRSGEDDDAVGAEAGDPPRHVDRAP